MNSKKIGRVIKVLGIVFLILILSILSAMIIYLYRIGSQLNLEVVDLEEKAEKELAELNIKIVKLDLELTDQVKQLLALSESL